MLRRSTQKIEWNEKNKIMFQSHPKNAKDKTTYLASVKIHTLSAFLHTEEMKGLKKKTGVYPRDS